MAENKAKIKEEALKQFAKGRWDKALEAYQKLAKLEPKDLKLRQKIGDIYSKMGKIQEAIEEYKEVAESYAEGGFLAKAIAVNKVIQSLDPTQEEVQQRLAQLYAKKTGKETGTPLPEQKVSPAKAKPTQIEAENESIQFEPDDESIPFEPDDESAQFDMNSLPHIPLFSDLTSEEFLKVIKKITPKSFEPESMICMEGDEGNSIFIISQGEVGVYKKNREGKAMWLNNLKEGDFFGEFGFLSESGRKASVKAVVESEVLEISKDDFKEIIDEFPRVSEVLVDLYKNRVLNNLLALSPLFEKLKPEEREKVVERFQLIVKDKDAIVVREGEAGDCLYIIHSGEVEVYTDKEGSKVVLANLREGDFFGEISLITGEKRTATVRTTQQTRLMGLSKEDFDSIAKEYPQVLDVARTFLEKRADDTITSLVSFEDREEKLQLV
ncbi:MAG: cyclic nucleotide-binding domain-containing protein [Candidatus Aerophobus sp.]|nr:MAG: cyclic nucleotide-binding domain-containing protein [Candidatus Aerophobus sp.]